MRFIRLIWKTEYWLPIEIKMGSKLYSEAHSDYPPIGIAYAVVIN